MSGPFADAFPVQAGYLGAVKEVAVPWLEVMAHHDQEIFP